jgi:hypothetical protein
MASSSSSLFTICVPPPSLSVRRFVSHSLLPDRISNARWFWSLQCAFQYKQKQRQNAAANIFNGASRIHLGAASWSTRAAAAAAAKEAATNGSRKVNVKKKRMGAQKVVVKNAQSSSEGGRSGGEFFFTLVRCHQMMMHNMILKVSRVLICNW